MNDKLFLRAFAERAAEPGKAGEPITFVASTEGVKRDGKDLQVMRWNLDNYQRNPVFLWAHDYMGRNLPIGRSAVEIDGKQLKAAVTFDQADDFARQVEAKYRNGYLNAVSVGWLDLARCKKCGNLLDAWSYWGMEYLRKKCPHCEAELTGESVDLEYDLLDISGVPVPGDPEALMEREYAALRAIMSQRISESARGAIPPHTAEKADEGAAWDGPGEVAKCPAERGPLRRMHAWVDGEGDPDAKQSYKLPHHLAESGQVVWRGVAAAMARLLQAGTQIPDGDRRGVYNHLARHYKQFDKEAPEFRTLEELEALGEEEIRGLFLEGEMDLTRPTPSPSLKGGERAGAVLSGRNKTDLEQAVTLIQGVLERAKKEEAQNSESANGQISNDELTYLQALNMRLALSGGKGNG